MSYVFTDSERAQIQAAISASSGITLNGDGTYSANAAVGSNAVPLYQTLSDIIGAPSGAISGTDLTDLKNAKLWLEVAIGANGNTGMHAAFIRAYTNRQGELRLGHAFSESEMQEASNAVARNLVNSLLFGDTPSGLLPWNLPRIDQIAGIDARAIGRTLFGPDSAQPLQPGDTAIDFNAAWSGTLGFNLLGGASPFESWRLIQAGDTGSATPNTLDDFKNLLFAVDAYDRALKAGYAAGGVEFLAFVFTRMQPIVFVPSSIADFEANLNISLSSGNWLGHINDVASRTPAIAPVVKLITDVGVNQFLDMLIGARLGKAVYGITTDANFLANVNAYLGALTPAQLQSFGAELMPTTAAAMVAKAKTDVNARAALAALSAVSVEIVATAAQDLDLYDPATGTGELTDLYLKDRAAMLSWKMKYDSGAKDQDDVLTDFLVSGLGGVIAGLYRNKAYSEEWDTNNISGDWNFKDLASQINGSPLALFIDGKGASILTADPDHQIIFGSNADESLVGQETSDHLYGMAGADTLTGGLGNDYLEGGQGNDTYLINAGDGYDTVLDSDGLGVVKFGTVEAKGKAGVTDATKWKQFSDGVWQDQQNGITYRLTVMADGSQTLLIKGATGSTVEVKGWSAGELGIVLGAGSSLPVPPAPATLLTGSATANYLTVASGGQRVEGLAGADMILGSGASGADHLLVGDGNDWIVGNGGADLIEGGLGNDTLSGIGGNSQAYGGDGNDLITAALAEGVRLLNIGSTTIPGLTADIIWADAQSGFGLSSGLIYDSAGNLDLAHGSVPLTPYGGVSALGGGWSFGMAFSGATWSITYSHPTLALGGKTPTGTWEHFIIPVSLTEGVFLFGEAGDDLIVGNNGADYLDGGSGKDQLFGHAGNDVLDGGTEEDTLAGGDGQDILLGGDHNDTLYGEQQDDVLIGGSGDDVLWGDSPNALLAAWDGSDYLDGGDGDDQLDSGGGNDTLLGGADMDLLLGNAGNDTLDGGAGIDTMEGGAGDDTYLNVTGEDIINDTEGNNTIVLASAIGLATGNALSTTNSGATLHMALDNGETLTLQNAPFGMNATLQFSNGEELDLETLVGTKLATPLYLGLDNSGGRLYGGSGADNLYGGSGNDALTGHLGNDTLQGGWGNDVYSFAEGDGRDTIVEIGGSSDVLRFEAGILPGNIKLLRWYVVESGGTVEDSLRLIRLNTDGTESGDYVHLKNYFQSVDDSKRVDRIEFSDDTVWTYADVQTRLLVPTNSRDLLNGYAGADVIDGLGGDDGINGKAGDDTLQGGAGDDDLQGGLGNDTLLGGAGNDRLLGYGNWLDDSSAANNDNGNDVLYGGTGKDRMYGGSGNDTYLFGRGDGFDEVIERPNASGASTDVLRLGIGVLPEHVTLYRVGVDGLMLVIDNSNTQILLSGYFAAGDYRVERIEFDGGAGAIWVAADVDAHVQVGIQNSMAGTSADDVFIVDYESDSISEAANSGTDTVLASRRFTLPNNVENLTLTGILNIDGYGNALNNILRGNSGDNALYGNGGIDIAYGGQGNDTYLGVTPIELADEGIDTYQGSGAYLEDAWVLPENIENWNLNPGSGNSGSYYYSAMGNALDNVLTTTGFGLQGDILDGGAGADTVIISGTDKPIVYIDNPGDQIIGTVYEIRSNIHYVLSSSVANRLVLVGDSTVNGTGNGFNNVLVSNQNTAANTLIGGLGDDTYLIGLNDRIVEMAGEGRDQVNLWLTESDSGREIHIADLNFENVERYGLAGNANNITLHGDAGDNELSARQNSSGNYGTRLYGGLGNDYLIGGVNDDVLNGEAGADVMRGGSGSDIYIVDNTEDQVIENQFNSYH